MGHTLRRPDGYIAKRTIEWKATSEVQHTWSRTRMAELEERQLKWQEAKRTSQNWFR